MSCAGWCGTARGKSPCWDKRLTTMAATWRAAPTWPTCSQPAATCLGLERIRFLTSHPLFMSDRIIEAVGSLPNVCEHFNIAVQSGDDLVLRQHEARLSRPPVRGLGSAHP